LAFAGWLPAFCFAHRVRCAAAIRLRVATDIVPFGLAPPYTLTNAESAAFNPDNGALRGHVPSSTAGHVHHPVSPSRLRIITGAIRAEGVAAWPTAFKGWFLPFLATIREPVVEMVKAKPTSEKIRADIKQLKSVAERLMEQASRLMERAAKLEDQVSRKAPNRKK
jgi:hypothetical protein